MKYKYTILLLTITSLLMLSCKTGKTIAEKIQGKWQLDSYSTKNQTINMVENKSNTGKANDIWDFRSDGNIYVTDKGSEFQLPYSVEGDSVFVMGAERYTIANLSKSSMKLYKKKIDKYTPTAFTETSYNFKK